MPKCTTCDRWCRTCGKCHHRTYCEFCNACNLHGQDAPEPAMVRAPRPETGRLFLVQVSFLTRRGWSPTVDVRVRSKGLAGALWKGVREARRAQLKRGTRVTQAKAIVVTT